MTDYTDARHIITQHEDTLARYLMHHPGDERHPLVDLVLELLSSLEYMPLMVAEEHTWEARQLMDGARDIPRTCGWMPDWKQRQSDMVKRARWHNHEAIALRKAVA